jgi:Putative restriction endonuclease
MAKKKEIGLLKPGKFWVYEKIIRIPYYGIYEIKNNHLEVYHNLDFSYHKLEPNDRGHYPIPLLDVELGLWHGTYQNQTQTWLRWWDNHGNLLLIGQEQAKLEKHRAEQEKQRADRAEKKALKMAEQLRAMGFDPESLD